MNSLLKDRDSICIKTVSVKEVLGKFIPIPE
jgi:hypothetical protein